MVRGKFQLQEVRQHHYHPSARTLVFQACYDPTIPEDRNFAKTTPNGRVEMFVDNPAVLDQLELGKQYYFDISPVE